MDPITLALEGLNLAPVFFVSVFLASVISIVVMQLTSKYRINASDPVWVQNAHRGLFILMALTFVWMISFAFDRSWQPWPPMFVFVIVYDLLMLLRAFVIYRTAPKPEPVRKTVALPHRSF